jgi:NADPH:quinone reductase-like Zn-dependent oxidoreductase
MLTWEMIMTQTMRAIGIEQYGGPDVLKWYDKAPIPSVRAGEVLAKVICAGVNFMDIHTRQGKYRDSCTYSVRVPCILGMEGSGIVVAVGEEVNHLKVGDRIAWCIAWGSYAEYVAIPVSRTARIADEISHEIAAAAMFQGCTAHYLIHDVAKLGQGDTCLVHAGSGSIGQLLIQMGCQLDATVYATASNAHKQTIATALGAKHVLSYDDGSFADEIRLMTGGHGVDVVFDSLGKATLRDSFRATRKRGLVVNYGNVSGSVGDLDPYELGEAGSLFLTRPRLADHMIDAEIVQRRANEVFGAIAAGKLNVTIDEIVSLNDVSMVHERIEERRQIGKAVVRI